MDDRSTAISAAEVADDGAEIAAAVKVAKAIREITAGVLTTVNSFCRWIQRVAAEVAAQQEMEMALRWASVDNRPLYNRYRHTKKKRIRKKYAKRILEWYRTEVAPC